MDRTCSSCKNCLMEDYGYSNYTVEGTYVHCMINKHPENGFDNFYGIEAKLKYAEQCEYYNEGDCEFIDVDGEDYDDLSEMAKSYLNEQ